MPLEFRTQRDGSLRPTWYGRYELNGRLVRINLQVKLAGTPPASYSLRDQGDTAFEVSRIKAQTKLNEIVDEARRSSGAVRILEKIYEEKTGDVIESVKLEKLSDEWAKIPRRRAVNGRYADQCKSTLDRFVKYVRDNYPQAIELMLITPTMARAFMDAEAKRGVTSKTWNDTLKLLRATYRYLAANGSSNPFEKMPTKETDTVFRIPFTPEELRNIMEAAKDDEEIRPIIITGMCTAMRRGDCCLLEWEDVDLKNYFITVKTSKTGQTVSIPIFPMLASELEQRAKQAGPRRTGHVFPAQAAMYKENPDGITWRVKKILAVGLREPLDESASDGPMKARKALPEISSTEARKKGEAYIAGLSEGEKRERMSVVFKHYMDGKNIHEVMAETKASKGSVSGYLNEIQEAIGCRILRGIGAAMKSEDGSIKDAMIDAGLQIKRKVGLRRASVRDFHSFRVTWVTLALTAGVAMELVQKVTGHKTTDIVLKHYFQPGREAFRTALNKAMPALLTNGQKVEGGGLLAEDGEQKMLNAESGEKRDKEIRAILEHSTAKTWKEDQARVLKMLTGRNRKPESGNC